MADLSKLPPPPAWAPKVFDADIDGDTMVEDDWRTDRTDTLPDAVRPSADACPVDKRMPVRRTVQAVRLGWETVRSERTAWRLEPLEAKRFHLDHFGPDGHSPNPDKHDAALSEVQPAVDLRIKWHRAQIAALVLFYVVFTWYWWINDSTWLTLALGVSAGCPVAYLAVRGRAAYRPDTPSADDRPDDERTDWMPSARTALDGPTLTTALELSVPDFKEGMELAVGPPRRMGEDGTAVDVYLPAKVSSSDVIAAKHDLATRLDASDARLVLRSHRDRNRKLTIGLFPTDPMAGPPIHSPLSSPRPIDISKGIPFGTSDTGIRVQWKVIGAHGFVGGTTRIGKTDTVRLVAAGVALDPDARMLMLDPEGFDVFAAYSRRATVISGTTAERRRAMADALEELATKGLRERELAIAAWQLKFPRGMHQSSVDDRIARNAEAGLPYQFVLLDECHALFGDPDPITRAKAITSMHTLVSRGGKYGIWCLLTTQRPTKEGGTPPEILAQCDTRFCMAMTETAGVTAVLRGKWAQTGMDPLALDSDEHKGVGYLTGWALPAALRPWGKARADWIDTNGHPAIAEFAVDQITREDILPRDTDALAPGQTPEPTEELDSDDPQILEDVIWAMRQADQALSETIITQLREDVPTDATYARLIPRGMNKLLRHWGVETETVREGDRKGKGLRLAKLQIALSDSLEDPAPQGCPDAATQAPAGQGAGQPKKASDLRCHAAPQDQDPPVSVVKPLLGLVPGMSRHLGQVPLPASYTIPGGFS